MAGLVAGISGGRTGSARICEGTAGGRQADVICDETYDSEGWRIHAAAHARTRAHAATQAHVLIHTYIHSHIHIYKLLYLH